MPFDQDVESGNVSQEPQEVASTRSTGPGNSVTNRTRSSNDPTPPSDDLEKYKEDKEEPTLGFKERVRHFMWTWFTMTMATGGIANVLYSVSLRFTGLYAIGCIFLILNIVLFVFNCVMITLRFIWWPSTFRASFLHPTESLFVPAFINSIGTILLNVTQYGLSKGKTGPWLITTMTVFYWIYLALAIISSLGFYLLIWSTQVFRVQKMTPLWIFPAYPLLFVGPFAGILAKTSTGQTGNQALDIIVGGVIAQGIGFMLSFMVYSAYIYRLMTEKLPEESSRPAMFVSVGPVGFTTTAIINMGQNFSDCVPSDFMGNGALAGQVTKILADWFGIWLWGLTVWFFLVSVAAHSSTISHGRMNFAMTWYSFIFPNTALVTATFAVAKALSQNYAIEIIGCIMACTVIGVWIFVFSMMWRAIFIKQILWPDMQEDKDGESHAWKKHLKASQEKDQFGPRAKSNNPLAKTDSRTQ